MNCDKKQILNRLHAKESSDWNISFDLANAKACLKSLRLTAINATLAALPLARSRSNKFLQRHSPILALRKKSTMA